MSNILDGQASAVNAIDNILVFVQNHFEHDQRLKEVLQPNQCRCGVQGVKMQVQRDRRRLPRCHRQRARDSAEPKKCEAVQHAEQPVDIGGVRKLLGTVNHVGGFLPHLSDTMAPLRALPSKNCARTRRCDRQAAFPMLKKILSSEVCMARYHPVLPTIASADASSFVLCAMLLQDQFSSKWRAAAFASRSPTPKEQQYGHSEREALAVT